MERLLYKVGLIDYLTIQLGINKNEFNKRLKDIMDIPFYTHETKRKRRYNGQVSEDEFSFNKKKMFFDNDPKNLVQVIGTTSEQGGKLTIKAKVTGQPLPFLMILLTIGLLFIMPIMTWDFVESHLDFVFIFNGSIVFALLFQYFNLRKGISRMTETAESVLKRLEGN